jgi:dephospho-CoA kinase
MKRFYELQEGVYDPGIFKAFFLAGGPGSGKSYVTSRITPGLGLKNVNSDTAFENALKKAGLSLDMPPEEKELRDVIRTKSKRLTEKQLGLYLKGRLGLVIDSTARNFVKIETAKSALTRFGYDSYCIFVNTNLDVALARNAARSRKVPIDIVKQNHKEVQENIGKLQRLFGMKNFIVIDNNNANDDILEKAYKMVRRLVKNPPSTGIAKNWIANQLKKKKMKEDIDEAPRIPRKKGQPAGSKKHSDLYTDENPKGTIHGLGFKDVETARASVKKIENSGKTHAHKIQAAIAMEQRARVMGKTQEAAIYRAYINKMKKKTKEMNKEQTTFESLWANIHKKRQRIKRGSGERMRKPGEKGAPSADALKRAKGESFTKFLEKAPNTADAMKRYKAGNAGFTDKAHLKAKGLIPRADGTKKVSDKYK